MAKNPDEEKKTSRRIKPVVEEVESDSPAETPPAPSEPVAPPVEAAVPVEPEPVVPAPADPTPEVEEVSPSTTDEKAKDALLELESAQSEHKRSNRKLNLKLLLGLTFLVALIVGFIAGGLYVYTTGTSLMKPEEQNQENNSPSPEPAQEQEATPAPTATPEPIDVSEFTVSILNGSGKVGEAGKVETLLEDGGFTVGNTGNASRYNYTDTIIQVQEDVPETVVAKLEEALSDNYSVEVGDKLPETSTFDIVITVGSKAN